MRITLVVLILSPIVLWSRVSRAEDGQTSLRMDMVEQVIVNIERMQHEIWDSTLDPAIVIAMRDIPRHEFVPEKLRPFSYFDIPLPVGYAQNTSQPYLIALMTQLAGVDKNNRVFETGTGSGYHAAILSRFAARVFSVEVVKPLANSAARRLEKMGYTNIEVRHADGFYGWKERGPFDAMIIKEAVPQIPATLINQL